MSTWLRRTLITASVFIAVWLLVIVYWQINSRMPGVAEVVLYLGALPLALLGVVWVIRKSIKASQASAAAASASAAAGSSKAQAEVAALQAQSDAQERALTLTLLAHAMRSPKGASAQEFVDALKSNQSLVALDAELVGEDGFPLFVARVPDLDTDALAPTLQDVCADIGLAALAWSQDQLRALSMAAAALAEPCAALTSHALFAPYAAANSDAKRAAIALPKLQFLALLPSRWSDEHRKAALVFLGKQVEQCGWPGNQLMFNPLVASPSTDALGLIDRLMLRAQQKKQAFLALVVACDSYVSEAAVAELEADGRLLTHQRKGGEVPGEGAACMLLSDVASSQHYPADNWATLHRVAQGRRDKSVDAAGKIGAAVMTELGKNALTVAGLQADAVGYIVADCDQRPNRVAELLEFGGEVFPDIDVAEQCFRVSAGNGLCGDVATLTALCLAHDLCNSEAATSVCVSNQDAWARSVVVVKPHVPMPVGSGAAA